MAAEWQFVFLHICKAASIIQVVTHPQPTLIGEKGPRLFESLNFPLQRKKAYLSRGIDPTGRGWDCNSLVDLTKLFLGANANRNDQVTT